MLKLDDVLGFCGVAPVLLRGEDDVGVVGQHKDVLGVRLFDGLVTLFGDAAFAQHVQAENGTKILLPVHLTVRDAKCAKKYALNARCTGKRNVINQPRQPAA